MTLENREDTTIEVRLIQTHDEYRAVERLQREVWGHEDLDVVPDHLLITIQKNGGLVLGAFEPTPEEGSERLIGFALGFIGLSPEGKMKHCSHMVGVARAHQNRNVGYLLKLAQREHVRAQGMDHITWTFDLLESRNARLNFHKLGATCNTYLRDLYGNMRDELNVGLPSDRFQVDWHIASPHVASQLGGDWIGPSLSALESDGVPILNRCPPGKLPCPPQEVLPLAGERLLVQIPARFQTIKSADAGLARAWKEHARMLFESAFAAGYTVVDLVFTGELSYYLLEKDWKPR
jgi:predicted GNAT superfamily acetyltransferase